MSALFGGKKKGVPAPPKPLVEPPPKPADATPSIPVAPALPQVAGAGIEETLRQAAGRKKAKTGRSGTLLSGPRGIETPTAPQRKTLLGY